MQKVHYAATLARREPYSPEPRAMLPSGRCAHMSDELPDERPFRRREYSGPASTLGLAALIVCVVGAAIWYFEFRNGGSAGGAGTPGLGIVELSDSLNPTGSPPAAREGRAAPDFRLATLGESAESLTDYRGKYVLVNFWASWCGPCRKETPDLQSFFEHNAGRGFVILGLNQQEQPRAAKEFVEEFGMTYPVLLDRSGEVSQAYGVGRGMPISFLVNPEGVIEEVTFGVLTDETLAEIAEKLQ
jgi:peroxiredoxin